MTALALALALLVMLLLVLVWQLATKVDKYKTRFREVATDLYNVTADRDALFIQNTGLKQRPENHEQVLGRSNRLTTLKPEHLE